MGKSTTESKKASQRANNEAMEKEKATKQARQSPTVSARCAATPATHPNMLGGGVDGRVPTLFDCLLCPEYAFCAYDEGGTANCSRPAESNKRATKRANDKR